jgi:hypothetical protein
MPGLLQQIIDNVYRYPKANLARYRRFGGYRQYRQMIAGEHAMRKAAETLPSVPSFTSGLPIFFLTGKNYLHQTLFCIRSLSLNTAAQLKFVLVDDGTFDSALTTRINRQLPGATLVTQETITHNLDRLLPAEAYPHLRARRAVYPHLRKLTDIHTLDAPEWKLVLDSDMLFWQEPVELINWLNHPTQPIYMTDCVESYGYTQELMSTLTADDIPSKLNVGIIGLSSTAINWKKLDGWIEVLEQKQGTSYYLEQALTAMLIGSRPCTVLDASAYEVNPPMNGKHDDVVLQHYVDLSKKIYYGEAWKKLIPPVKL